MSYRFKIVSVRPNTAIPFYTKSSIDLYHVYNNYILTDKKIDISTTYSEDLLEETSIVEFSSKEAWTEYQTDPGVIIHLDKKNLHNLENGINVLKTDITEV